VTTELVHLDIADGVATITLDSVKNRNALSRQLMTELSGHLDRARDDESVQVVVLTHTGKVFCAGADLGEAADGMQEGARALLNLLRTIAELPKPVLARIAGPVRAGGLGIVGACDIAITVDTVAFTEARLGLAPAIISLTTLPRMEPRPAHRWFLTGEAFDAHAAAQAGLVSAAVPAEHLDAAVREVVDELRKASPQGLAETKRLLGRTLARDIDEHGEEMVALSARLFASEEAKEGMSAFLEKRAPHWQPNREQPG
jgi:enoyl-CoA hydratase